MTNERANEIINICNAIIKASDANQQISEKMVVAAEITLDNAKDFLRAYNNRIAKINLEYASVDEKNKTILRDQYKEYVYTKENAQKRLEAIEALLSEECLNPFEVVTTTETEGLTRSEIRYAKQAGFIVD